MESLGTADDGRRDGRALCRVYGNADLVAGSGEGQIQTTPAKESRTEMFRGRREASAGVSGWE